MSEKFWIKLKPFDMVIKELGYTPRKGDINMYESEMCDTDINERMIHFFGSEIEVGLDNELEPGTYRYNYWTINDMWVEKDPFKVSEVNDLFDIMLEEI